MSRSRASNRESSVESPVAEPVERAPRVVSRFEATLVRLLRAFLRPQPGEPASAPPPPTAAGKLVMPVGLSDDCLELVRDSLSKGCVLYLARAGGWRRERYLRLGQVVEGRLWERSGVPELALGFTPHSVRFLMWLTAGRPTDKGQNWDPDLAELSVGDLFLLLLAYEGLRDADAQAMQALRAKPQFARNGLVRLFFPEDFPNGSEEPPDYAPWTSGTGAAILEALQPRLQRRWLDIERAKVMVGEWDRLRGTGRSQEQALTHFLTACEAAKRPDLARFLLKVLAELLSRDLTPAFWTGGLQPSTAPPRLADRLETQRQALALLRQVDRIAGWARNYAGTRFFDEDYAIAQMFLADWERYRGEEVATIAQNLLRQLEPLRVSSPSTGSNSESQKSEVSSQ